jgi:hypothetical protein
VSVNKYIDHVYVIPEDDRDRQIADGFVLHHLVNAARIQVMPVAGGWRNVLSTFRDEYIGTLRRYEHAHVVMLIDFDGRTAERRAAFDKVIPDDLRMRVFVVGSKDNPETLRRALNSGLENIGKSLASDCDAGTVQHWDHDQLQHNDAERQRLVQIVKPFIFAPLEADPQFGRNEPQMRAE